MKPIGNNMLTLFPTGGYNTISNDFIRHIDTLIISPVLFILRNEYIRVMPITNAECEHGEYDTTLTKWYCSYWMTKEEWMEVHDYAPHGLLSKEDD
jgi:hypothetical protein